MVFKIPFALLPPNFLRGLAAKLKNMGGFLSAFFPGLSEELLQAQIDLTTREYASIGLAVGLSNGIIATLFVLIMSLILKAELFGAAILIGLLVANASFFTLIAYPRILTSKRVRLQENQLIPATRQLLIELKSGVPLFNAMTSISTGYGEVSLEFRKIVNKISGGVPELDALADATRANPSLQFRKVLWQISNALKVGSDVGDSLSSLLSELEKEKIDQIHKYGQELSPWTMVYMLAAVVVPSLGVTMLIVLSSFLTISLPAFLLPFLLIANAGFQLFFMNFISTRRPIV